MPLPQTADPSGAATALPPPPTFSFGFDLSLVVGGRSGAAEHSKKKVYLMFHQRGSFEPSAREGMVGGRFASAVPSARETAEERAAAAGIVLPSQPHCAFCNSPGVPDRPSSVFDNLLLCHPCK